MTGNKPSGIEVMLQAYAESDGEYLDMVVEHGELPGITLEHLKFWGENLNEPANYRMWHPEDHVSHDIKTVTEADGRTVSYMYAEERVGEYAAGVFCLRQEEPDSAPVKQVYQPLATNTSLGPNGEVLGGVYHEFQQTPTGMIMRSTFRMPAKTPKEYQDAMYRHSKEEMANFPKFLPELYARVTGKK